LYQVAFVPGIPRCALLESPAASVRTGTTIRIAAPRHLVWAWRLLHQRTALARQSD
jgi:hypothetical protein